MATEFEKALQALRAQETLTDYAVLSDILSGKGNTALGTLFTKNNIGTNTKQTSIKDMQKQTGIQTDMQTLLKYYQDAANAAANVQRTELGSAEDAYYRGTGLANKAAAAKLADMLALSQNNGVNLGAAQNTLGKSVLAQIQENAAGAKGLSDARVKLGAELAAAMKEAYTTAQTTQSANANTLGTLANNANANAAQNLASYLALGQTALQSEQMLADRNNESARKLAELLGAQNVAAMNINAEQLLADKNNAAAREAAAIAAGLYNPYGALSNAQPNGTTGYVNNAKGKIQGPVKQLSGNDLAAALKLYGEQNKYAGDLVNYPASSGGGSRNTAKGSVPYQYQKK